LSGTTSSPQVKGYKWLKEERPKDETILLAKDNDDDLWDACIYNM